MCISKAAHESSPPSLDYFHLGVCDKVVDLRDYADVDDSVPADQNITPIGERPG